MLIMRIIAQNLKALQSSSLSRVRVLTRPKTMILRLYSQWRLRGLDD